MQYVRNWFLSSLVECRVFKKLLPWQFTGIISEGSELQNQNDGGQSSTFENDVPRAVPNTAQFDVMKNKKLNLPFFISIVAFV